MRICNSVAQKAVQTLFLFVLPASIFAQKWEIGTGIGINQYKGDVMPTYKPLIVRPAANTFARMNISRAVSLKIQGMYGGLVGKDKFMKSEPYHQAREYSFNATLAEGSGQVEYNFLNFRTHSSRIVDTWTPYVFGGYGMSLISTRALLKTNINPSIFTAYNTEKVERVMILGIGLKKQWKQRWNWGIEFGARHSSSDFLDNIGYSAGKFEVVLPTGISPSDPAFLYLLKYQTPGTKVKDVYYYTNFSVSYVFYKVHCPTRR